VGYAAQTVSVRGSIVVDFIRSIAKLDDTSPIGATRINRL
jgi:hypothetical protein